MILVRDVRQHSIASRSFQKLASFLLALPSRFMTRKHTEIWICQGSALTSPLIQEMCCCILASDLSELRRLVQSLREPLVLLYPASVISLVFQHLSLYYTLCMYCQDNQLVPALFLCKSINIIANPHFGNDFAACANLHIMFFQDKIKLFKIQKRMGFLISTVALNHSHVLPFL